MAGEGHRAPLDMLAHLRALGASHVAFHPDGTLAGVTWPAEPAPAVVPSLTATPSPDAAPSSVTVTDAGHAPAGDPARSPLVAPLTGERAAYASAGGFVRPRSAPVLSQPPIPRGAP